MTHAELKKDPLYKTAVREFLDSHVRDLELWLMELHARKYNDLTKLADYMCARKIGKAFVERVVGAGTPAQHRRCGGARTP